MNMNMQKQKKSKSKSNTTMHDFQDRAAALVAFTATAGAAGPIAARIRRGGARSGFVLRTCLRLIASIVISGGAAMLMMTTNTMNKAEAATAATRTAATTAAAAVSDPPPSGGSIFKPFVLVRIPMPDGYTSGQVTAISDDGTAVGYLTPSSGPDAPFLFSPSDDSLTLLDAPSGHYNFAHATAISPDGDTAAGYGQWKAAPPYYRPVTWNLPGGSINPTTSAGVTSKWLGINDTPQMVGWYHNDGDGLDEALLFDGTGFVYPQPGLTGALYSINNDGYAAGYYIDSNGASRAYRWSNSTGIVYNLPLSGYDESSAACINAGMVIGGWLRDSANPSIDVPTIWIPGSLNAYTAEPFAATASSAVVAINSHGEAIIERYDATAGFAVWSHHGNIDEANVLYDAAATDPYAASLVLMRNTDDEIGAMTCISDNLWIGGSYYVHGAGGQQPCLIIPYDVNNNAAPDYREMVDAGLINGHHPNDLNDNWLLDTGEAMRVGLCAPGYSSDNYYRIDDDQIVRQQMHLKYLSMEQAIAGDDSYPLDLVVGDGPQDGDPCGNFQTAIENWSRGDGTHNAQREIAIWLRSSLDSTDMNYDYLPADEAQKADVLADIHAFGRRFAHCIDYLQTGNEVFGGAGQYKIRGGDLDQGCTWTGASKTLSEIHDDPNLGLTCEEEAIGRIFDWLHEQMWAALEGSALAGRPLRMTGPGIVAGSIRAGYSAGVNDPNRYIVTHTIDWCNTNQMYFDFHDHYISLSESTEAVQKLTGTGSYTSPPWNLPTWRMCLEWGPKVNMDLGWATTHRDDFSAFMKWVPDGNPPDYDYWEDFVNDWNLNQWGPGSDFNMDDVLSALDATYFTGAYYAPCNQLSTEGNEQPEYDLAALRATDVRDALIQTPYHFTILKDDYETDAGAYQIQSFEPHPDQCQGCSN